MEAKKSQGVRGSPGSGTVVECRCEADEFQYLASDEDGFREGASELNAVWEADVRRDGPLLVVLSGSAVQTVRRLEAGGSPLFGRLDWRHRLAPFDYYDAAAMVTPYSKRDQVLTYAAFGGTPKYLDSVDPSRPLDENIVDLLLAPDGKVTEAAPPSSWISSPGSSTAVS